MKHLRALFALALLVPAPAAHAAGPSLDARPEAAPLTIKAGVSRVTDHAFAYVPANLSGPAPLIVLLHGAGQQADLFLESFYGQADRRGAILLAVQSTAQTWTLKPRGAGEADFGTDPANINAAMTALFARAPVDPRRVAIMGFSDGASYALSIGLANPKLFRGVVALSPGTVWFQSDADRSQKLFIAHGRLDAVLPFANVRDRIVPELERAGLRPQLRWFGGGHEMDRQAVAAGIDHVLGRPKDIGRAATESIESPKGAQ